MHGRHKRLRVAADDSDDDSGSVTAEGSSVYFYADVTRATVLKLRGLLGEASAYAVRHTPVDEAPRVHLYLFSHGGDAFAGLAAVDHIRHTCQRVPVTTVAAGVVASAASFLLIAGARRLAYEHAFVRIHQLSIHGFEGKYADLCDEVRNTRELMNAIRALYRGRTQLAEERLDELLRKELDLDASACREAGLVDAVVDDPAGRGA
jgi:ATP-dependent protease ClpP protease subunit